MGEPDARTADWGYLSAADVAGAYRAGTLRPSEYVTSELSRIEAVDRGAVPLRSVLCVHPGAVDQARAADDRYERGVPVGPLDGIPVLVKDNIDTDDLPTTAGSLALAGDHPAEDADVVARLRRAGAVIVGKANLSEWANFRGHPSISGWSGVGGQCRNPYGLDRTPLGSSSGSAAALAAGLVPLALGTETNGSVIGPSHACGVVGLKPTVGVLSRVGVVPIAQSFDTVGPMGRSVRDVTALYEVLSATRSVAIPDPVVAPVSGDWGPDVSALLARAVEVLADGGVRVTDEVAVDTAELDASGASLLVLLCEFRDLVGTYLARRPTASVRSLEDVVAYNLAEPHELEHFGQELFELSLSTGGFADPRYPAALARCRRLAGPGGIESALHRRGADVLIVPAAAPAWGLDDKAPERAWSNWGPAAVAGYPSLTLPMGTVEGMPVGCLLVGRPFGEATLLDLGDRLEEGLALGLRPAWPATTL